VYGSGLVGRELVGSEAVQRCQSAASNMTETKHEGFARPLHWGCLSSDNFFKNSFPEFPVLAGCFPS
jgi:hypothetical protein